MEVEEVASGREEGELSDDGEIKGDSEEEGEAKGDEEANEKDDVNIPGLDLVNRPEDAVDIPGLDLVNRRTPAKSSRTRQASNRILEKYRHGKGGPRPNNNNGPRSQTHRPPSPQPPPPPAHLQSGHFWPQPPAIMVQSPNFHGPINHHNDPRHLGPSHAPHRHPLYPSPPPRYHHPWVSERDTMATTQDRRRSSGARDSNRSGRERHRSNGRTTKSRSASGDKLVVNNENDGDYDELLLRYKLVQKQLDALRKEDEHATKLLSGDDSEAKKEKDENEVATAQADNGQPGSEETAETKPKSEEEEDVDELELRLLALASAAKNLNKKPDQQSKPIDIPKRAQSQKQPRRRKQDPGKKTESNRRQSLQRRQNDRRGPSRRHVRQSPERPRRLTRRSSERERQKEWDRQKEREEFQRRSDEQPERPGLIASVLSIDDPEEQYRRFMKMVANNKSPTPRNYSRSQSKSPGRKLSSERAGEWIQFQAVAEGYVPPPLPPVLQDNYEEVEMDIDSNEGSPAILTEEQVPQFGFEDLYMFDAPLPPEEALSITALPPPPPPPEEPPPLPEEDPEEDEEEAELRAMLLQGIINKRKQMDKPEPEPVSEPSSRGDSPAPVVHKPKYVPRPKRVVHKPLVINLGGDSSDSDHENTGPSCLLGGLDSFLKQARKSVETPAAQKKKHSPTTPEAMIGMPEEKKREYKALKEKLMKKEKEKLAMTAKFNQESKASKAASMSSTNTKQDIQRLVTMQGDNISVKAVSSPDGSSVKAVQLPDGAGGVKAVSSPGGAGGVECEELELRYQECTEKIAIDREDIAKDELTLKAVKVQLGKRSTALRAAEEKIQKLQEQLSAAERIAHTHRTHMGKLNRQTTLLNTRIEKRNTALKQTESNLKDLELQLQRTTGTESIFINSAKRKAETEEQHIIKKAKTDVEGQPGIKESVSATEQIEKSATDAGVGVKLTKEQLQRLEQEYRIKIEMLKKTHSEKLAKEQDGKTEKRRMKFTPKRTRSTKPVSQPDLENIDKFSLSEVKETPANEEQSKVRRKSFLDLNISMKPNLEPDGQGEGLDPTTESKPVDDINNGNSSHLTEIKEAENDNSQVPTSTSQFAMPTGSQMENLCRLQKEKVEKFSVDEFSTKNQNYDLTERFYSRLQKIPGFAIEKGNMSESICDIVGPLGPYSSPLLNFRSYRFSPYFRQKCHCSLTSTTFSHKLNPKKALCRFDLKGTCNEECPWQHTSDHVMSDTEQLMDIISYCPSAAGVTEHASTEECEKVIRSWVETFKKQHEGKMSQEEMCILLVDKVNENIGRVPPCSTFTEPRKWKPKATCRTPMSQELKPKETQVLKDVNSLKSSVDPDDIISEQDVRYFMLNSHDVHDMESAVLETPHDTQLWIKLAYKKMRDHKSDGPADKGLEHALNVLARGLEANKHSTELWQHYLHLHKRLGQLEDTLSMCEQAVKLAPAYDVWWMYLSITKPFNKKEDLCEQIFAYLQKERHVPQAQVSHQILEILLYQVALNTQSGRYKSGVKVIQNVLKPTESNISPLCRCMVPQDRVLAWLAYLHLLETQRLPQYLFDPAKDNPGRIVCKEPFIIPWKGKRAKGTKDNPIQNFSLAFKQCSQSKLGTEVNIVNCMPLYRNLVALEVAKGRYEPAKGVCRKLLCSSPSNTDLWLCLADVCKKQKKPEEVRQILAEAISKVSGPKASVLYHAAANFELTQDDADSALEHLESCVIQLFDVDIKDSKTCDPNLLYCKVLGQSLPLTYKEPQYKEDISAEDISNHVQHLWLNYSLLLYLQGDDAQALEAYETALYTVKSVEDLRAIWISYLRHKFQVAFLKGKSANVTLLHDLSRRCLQTTPVCFPLPFCPSKHWNNYTFHNQVVDLYLQSLPKEQIGQAFQHFLKMMPGNVDLVVRSVQYFHEEEDEPAVLSVCYPALYDLPACSRLWKIAINLLLKQGKVKEVHKAYQKAVGNLPYTVSLWKDFILFAISQESPEVVTQLINESNKLDVNIAPFVATILKLS